VTAFSKHIGKAYHVSQRYNYKWIMNTISSNVLTETAKFKEDLVNFKKDEKKKDQKMDTEMFDCTDKDDLGMTSFLAHTIDNSDVRNSIKNFQNLLNHSKSFIFYSFKYKLMCRTKFGSQK
jgi:dipeptidase